MDHLRHMSIFAHIVESGSITKAAEHLQLSKSVVSQHLKLLEQALGVLLIMRSTRTHILTSAGKEFYQSCKEINKIADTAWQLAQQTTEVPKDYLKITAPNALMDVVIAPAIGELLKRYPKLEPELISADTHLDLMAENIDLAIRVGRSTPSNIKQRRLGSFRDVFCGSPSLVNKQDINAAIYIANIWQGKHVHHHFTDAEGHCKDYQATAQCRANSFYSCLSLLKEGAGVGLIPDFQFFAVKALLVEIFPNFKLPENHVYALYPYQNHLPLHIKVCVEAIEERLANLSKLSN